MIEARGVIARFSDSTEQRVHAWSDDGTPLVLGSAGLEPAERAGDYELFDVGVSTVIGGGGWMVHGVTEADEDGETSHYIQPVVAWRVDEDGTGEPLVADADGTVVPGRGPGVLGYFHPNEDEHPAH